MQSFSNIPQICLGVFMAMGLAQPASAFNAINNHRVNPVPGTAQFEVIGRPGSGHWNIGARRRNMRAWNWASPPARR